MNLYDKYSHIFEHFQSGGRGGKDWKELNCSESNDEDHLSPTLLTHISELFKKAYAYLHFL